MLVEDRTLSSDVVTRGTGRFGSPRKLSVAASALKANPGFVTDVPVVGTEFVEGDVMMTASGRPLILLVGDQPLARDLGPGMSGDDVAQLEDALPAPRIRSGSADGVYDDATEEAVTAWYDANGFSEFTATEDQLAAIRTREAELTTARLEILNADDSVEIADAALASARSGLTVAQNRSALASRARQRAVDEAAANNAAAAADVSAKQVVVDTMRSGQTPPSRPEDIAAAQADLATATSNATSVAVAGTRAVADAQAVVDDAPANLVAATEAAASADAAAAAEVAAKQAILDDLLANPAATETQKAVAAANLATAEAIADTVRASGEQAVADAQDVVDGAPAALAVARAEADAANAAAAADVASKEAALSALTNPSPPTASDIAAAEADLATAQANANTIRLAGEAAVDQANVELADAQADVVAQQSVVTAARNAQTNAKTSLEERTSAGELAQQEADLAHRQAGVQVPADEVVFVAIGPVRLSELLVGTGDPVIGGVMLVTDSRVFVDGSLAVEDAGLVEAGMTVAIDEAIARHRDRRRGQRGGRVAGHERGRRVPHLLRGERRRLHPRASSGRRCG